MPKHENKIIRNDIILNGKDDDKHTVQNKIGTKIKTTNHNITKGCSLTATCDANPLLSIIAREYVTSNQLIPTCYVKIKTNVGDNGKNNVAIVMWQKPGTIAKLHKRYVNKKPLPPGFANIVIKARYTYQKIDGDKKLRMSISQPNYIDEYRHITIEELRSNPEHEEYYRCTQWHEIISQLEPSDWVRIPIWDAQEFSIDGNIFTTHTHKYYDVTISKININYLKDGHMGRRSIFHPLESNNLVIIQQNIQRYPDNKHYCIHPKDKAASTVLRTYDIPFIIIEKNKKECTYQYVDCHTTFEFVLPNRDKILFVSSDDLYIIGKNNIYYITIDLYREKDIVIEGIPAKLIPNWIISSNQFKDYFRYTFKNTKCFKYRVTIPFSKLQIYRSRYTKY